ncbi:PadR family transcriptional regulator [Paenibacillus sp. HN-1]|uniref:PadR family transcriptional regulator n=1 Tax=Paenibacillus TaxID=44249 RepID=UPI001CA95307|nr:MULTISPECIES: PadR family transcriptional regulator [Paenibacillus]MBY9079656.1 PadR family transcriptional regulator [Paenibacillus sp. CGMCC 1.18879]MBY9082907.1 PadR family transcriptional regulator [Paenibacillus sinensis]
MTLQIFILGTLSEGEHHPYDIKKMITRALDNTSVSDGALYYHFESLRKKGLIEKVKVEQKENRPEKTTYGITDKGRQALEEEIYETYRSFTNVTSLYSSLLFLDKIDKVKLAYLIEEAIKRRENSRNIIKEADYDKSSIPARHKGALQLIEDHAREMVDMDINWLNALLDYIRSLD